MKIFIHTFIVINIAQMDVVFKKQKKKESRRYSSKISFDEK